MLAAAIANRRSLALELMHHNYNIQQQKLITGASPEVLLSWTAVLLDCRVLLPPLLTGWPVCPLDMLLALDWLRPCCLPLTGCVRVWILQGHDAR